MDPIRINKNNNNIIISAQQHSENIQKDKNREEEIKEYIYIYISSFSTIHHVLIIKGKKKENVEKEKIKR